MSYQNPRQLKKTYENPTLDALIEKFDEVTKKEREGQEKIQKSIDDQAVLTANNMGKINVPGNEKLENQFGQITVMSDHSELKQLIKNAEGLTGDLKLENTLQQDKVKGKIGEYQGLLTTLDFMSKKLVSSSGLNPGEEGSLSKTTSKEAMNVLNQYNQGGENLQFIKENGQIFLSETKEDGDRLNLTEAALIVGRGEEVLKTSMPIKSYEDTAAKTITDPTIAPWKVTVNTEIPLENGGVRSVTEVKIDKGLATQELMRNGSFDWVKDKTSYVIANQIWVDRMGQETFFNPANEKHELAIKEFLVQDTMKNVIPQSELKSDAIFKPKTVKKPPVKKKEKLPAKVNYILEGLGSLKDKEVGTSFNYSKTLQVKKTGENEWSLFDTVTDAGGNNSQKLVRTVSDPLELRGEFGVQHPSLIVTAKNENNEQTGNYDEYIDILLK